MIKTVDDWVTDRTQMASDWIHDMTGADSIVQSRCVSGARAVMWFVAIVYMHPVGGDFDYVGGILMAASLGRAFFESEQDEDAREASEMGMRNPSRIKSPLPVIRGVMSIIMASYPLGCLVFAAMGSLHFSGLLFGLILSAWLGNNLDACDVGGPRTSKIRKFLNDTLSHPAQQLQPVKE